MDLEQFRTFFLDRGRWVMKETVPFFHKSVLTFYERHANGSGMIFLDTLAQTNTLISSIGQKIPVLAIFILIAISLVYYYVYRPRDYTRNLGEVEYYLDFIDDAIPGKRYRKSNRKTKLERLADGFRRNSKIGDIPPVYPNGWFALLESSDIERNQVKYIAALGENFAVFRTSDGKIRMVDAYCSHLGANMGVGGKVKGDCLECPFHGWQYDGITGKCTKVPYAEKVPDFARVRTWRSLETNGYVFVWYHVEGKEPTWEPCQRKQISDGTLWYVGRFQHLINCHIQEIAENGADFGHFDQIHSPLIFGGSGFWSYCKKSLSALVHHDFIGQGWKTDPDLPHVAIGSLSNQFRIMGKVNVLTGSSTVKYYGPGYIEVTIATPLGPVFIVMGVTPVEPLVQKTVIRVFCRPLLLPLSQLFFSFAVDGFERDILMWELKRYRENPTLVKEEESILLYRRWFTQFYSVNSPRYKTQQELMDW